jgi:hypothetical protein
MQELYANSYGCVSQCDKSRSLVIDFLGTPTHYKVTCFIALKRQVDAIDVELMLLSDKNADDCVIISPCSCERVYVLDAVQLLGLKDLLAGAKCMLEFNSILHECLRPSSIA